MAGLRLLSAALIAVALLAAPTMARERHVSSGRLTEDANACIAAGSRNVDGHSCYRASPGERDVWGHWGAYYGPMVHVR
jgi:hypothetical protein